MKNVCVKQKKYRLFFRLYSDPPRALFAEHCFNIQKFAFLLLHVLTFISFIKSFF